MIDIVSNSDDDSNIDSPNENENESDNPIDDDNFIVGSNKKGKKSQSDEEYAPDAHELYNEDEDDDSDIDSNYEGYNGSRPSTRRRTNLRNGVLKSSRKRNFEGSSTEEDNDDNDNDDEETQDFDVEMDGNSKSKNNNGNNKNSNNDDNNDDNDEVLDGTDSRDQDIESQFASPENNKSNLQETTPQHLHFEGKKESMKVSVSQSQISPQELIDLTQNESPRKKRDTRPARPTRNKRIDGDKVSVTVPKKRQIKLSSIPLIPQLPGDNSNNNNNLSKVTNNVRSRRKNLKRSSLDAIDNDEVNIHVFLFLFFVCFFFPCFSVFQHCCVIWKELFVLYFCLVLVCDYNYSCHMIFNPRKKEDWEMVE